MIRDYIENNLRMQAIIIAPYGWDAAVCELMFAALKTVNLNPDNLPTGKK